LPKIRKSYLVESNSDTAPPSAKKSKLFAYYSSRAANQPSTSIAQMNRYLELDTTDDQDCVAF